MNLYGDPAGNARNHSGKSDWQMVREYFARESGYQLNWLVPAKNPAVRDRVNAANGALLNAVGEVRVTLSPKCKTLIRDFERVVWLRDSNGVIVGEVSKKDPELTHISDACTYMVHQKFPLANKVRITVI